MRRWRGWVLLERDGTLYRVSIDDPATTVSGKHLLEMGWQAVPVDIIEREDK
jgi:hypothetical protein